VRVSKKCTRLPDVSASSRLRRNASLDVTECTEAVTAPGDHRVRSAGDSCRMVCTRIVCTAGSSSQCSNGVSFVTPPSTNHSPSISCAANNIGTAKLAAMNSASGPSRTISPLAFAKLKTANSRLGASRSSILRSPIQRFKNRLNGLADNTPLEPQTLGKRKKRGIANASMNAHFIRHERNKLSNASPRTPAAHNPPASAPAEEPAIFPERQPLRSSSFKNPACA